MPTFHGAKQLLQVAVLLLLSLLFTVTTSAAGTVLAAANGFGWD